MNRSNLWTPEEEKIAEELLSCSGISEEYFQEKVGRSKTSANSHFYYKKHGSKRPRKRIRELSGPAGGAMVLSHARPTEDMLEAARKRLLAPRTPTQYWFGDPPTGESALDKRNASHCIA